MISLVHTGGYAAIQVKHWWDVNLKLNVCLICLELLFFLCIAIFGISLEALIRLHDA